MDRLIERNLLRIDAIGALSVGLGVWLLADWLQWLYEVPKSLLLFNAAANLIYGSYSTTLSLLTKRPLVLIVVLSIANIAWATACLVASVVLVSSGHLLAACSALLETWIVGGLGFMEWRYRRRLVLPTNGEATQDLAELCATECVP